MPIEKGDEMKIRKLLAYAMAARYLVKGFSSVRNRVRAQAMLKRGRNITATTRRAFL